MSDSARWHNAGVVHDLLDATLQYQDEARRAHADEVLRTALVSQDQIEAFCLAMCAVLCDSSPIPINTRLQASVQLKNAIGKWWKPRAITAFSEGALCSIRGALARYISTPPASSKALTAAVASAIAHIFCAEIRSLPRAQSTSGATTWPDLVPAIAAGLASSNTDASRVALAVSVELTAQQAAIRIPSQRKAFVPVSGALWAVLLPYLSAATAWLDAWTGPACGDPALPLDSAGLAATALLNIIRTVPPSILAASDGPSPFVGFVGACIERCTGYFQRPPSFLTAAPDAGLRYVRSLSKAARVGFDVLRGSASDLVPAATKLVACALQAVLGLSAATDRQAGLTPEFELFLHDSRILETALMIAHPMVRSPLLPPTQSTASIGVTSGAGTAFPIGAYDDDPFGPRSTDGGPDAADAGPPCALDMDLMPLLCRALSQHCLALTPGDVRALFEDPEFFVAQEEAVDVPGVRPAAETLFQFLLDTYPALVIPSVVDAINSCLAPAEHALDAPIEPGQPIDPRIIAADAALAALDLSFYELAETSQADVTALIAAVLAAPWENHPLLARRRAACLGAAYDHMSDQATRGHILHNLQATMLLGQEQGQRAGSTQAVRDIDPATAIGTCLTAVFSLCRIAEDASHDELFVNAAPSILSALRALVPQFSTPSGAKFAVRLVHTTLACCAQHLPPPAIAEAGAILSALWADASGPSHAHTRMLVLAALSPFCATHQPDAFAGLRDTFAPLVTDALRSTTDTALHLPAVELLAALIEGGPGPLPQCVRGALATLCILVSTECSEPDSDLIAKAVVALVAAARADPEAVQQLATTPFSPPARPSVVRSAQRAAHASSPDATPPPSPTSRPFSFPWGPADAQAPLPSVPSLLLARFLHTAAAAKLSSRVTASIASSIAAIPTAAPSEAVVASVAYVAAVGLAREAPRTDSVPGLSWISALASSMVVALSAAAGACAQPARALMALFSAHVSHMYDPTRRSFLALAALVAAEAELAAGSVDAVVGVLLAPVTGAGSAGAATGDSSTCAQTCLDRLLSGAADAAVDLAARPAVDPAEQPLHNDVRRRKQLAHQIDCHSRTLAGRLNAFIAAARSVPALAHALTQLDAETVANLVALPQTK
jgi:hypothetical protein